MQPSTLAKRGSLVLFLLIVAFYLYGLGQLPLLGPDEPRYAQVAREMFLRGDLITPTLGGHLWFEKPALLYWMMIGAYKLFGVSEWSARLPSAVSGILTIAAVFLVGRRVDERTAAEQLHGLGFWTCTRRQYNPRNNRLLQGCKLRHCPYDDDHLVACVFHAS